MNEALEGDLISDLLPLTSGSIHLTAAQLEQLLFRAAQLAYEAAELKRQTYATTPDGLRDKTIHRYKRVPYHTALSQSSTLQDVPTTGTETWLGDSINPIPSDCASRLFLNYPSPVLL